MNKKIKVVAIKINKYITNSYLNIIHPVMKLYLWGTIIIRIQIILIATINIRNYRKWVKWTFYIHLLCFINCEYLFFNFWCFLSISTHLHIEFYSSFIFTSLSLLFWAQIYQWLQFVYFNRQSTGIYVKKMNFQTKIFCLRINICICFMLLRF